MIKNYELTEEQSEKIPLFYFPGVSDNDLPIGLKIVERYDERICPLIVCSIDETRFHLTFYNNKPLINYLDIYSKSNEEFERAKSRLEQIFRLKF